MRPILLILPIIAALSFTNFSLVAGGNAASPASVIPGDSILIKDTLFVGTNLLIITNTLKITDTTSRPIIVNGQWLKKRITITEYKALPSDTIRVASKNQNSQKISNTTEINSDKNTEVAPIVAEVPDKNKATVKEQVSAANKKQPDKKVAATPETKTPITTTIKKETQTAVVPQPAKVATTPETKLVAESKKPIPNAEVGVKKTAKDKPEQTPAPNAVAEEEILLPTRVLQNSKDGKRKNKTAKANKTTPDTETSQSQLPVKAEPAATKAAEPTPKKTAITPTEAVPTVVVEKPAVTIPAVVPDVDKEATANTETINNVSIEIIDNNKVIGVRTDLPEDNLPPGGTLLLNLAQPTPDNTKEPKNIPIPDKQTPELPKNNKNVNPTEQEKPHTTIPEPNLFLTNPNTPTTKVVPDIPVTETNSINITPETQANERVILESKVITLGEAYQLTLEDVRKQHDIYAKAFKKAKTEDEVNEILRLAGHYLEDVIANDIVYYWYGTGFDKEGTSVSPGSGRIACSYFVATMLTEAGVNIDRIKLAQQSAQGIIKTLSKPEHLTRCITPDEVESLVKQKGRGLYFIGFSYHVGFLYYNGTDIDLIHASPLPPGTVSRISMKGARSFDYSNFYDIGKLTENKELIVNWLTGKKVPIVP